MSLKILPPEHGEKRDPVVAIYSLVTIGGHRKYAQALVSHLDTPCVIVTAQDSEAFYAQWRAPVLRWFTKPHRTVWSKGQLFFRHLRNMATLIRVARRLDVEIIHIQGIEPISLTLCLPLIRERFRLLLSVHNVTPHRFYSRFTSKAELWLWKLVYHQADALCVFSQYGARKLEDEFEVNSRKIHVLPMGCHEPLPDSPPARKGPPDQPTFLMFGSYRSNKGFEVLVDAFLSAKNDGLPGLLRVAGRYPEEVEDAARSLYQKTGFADSLEFLNYFIPEDEIEVLMRSSDVMVLPYTRFESQSGIVFLAYAYNMPIVASRVGGLTEVIESDGTGVLVAPNDVQDLRRGLFEIIKRWESVAKTQSNQLLTSKYSWNRIGRLTDVIYSTLIRDT